MRTVMAVLCVICCEETSKYKCSSCFSPYCSLSCWKKHKTDENCKPKQQPQVEVSSQNNAEKKKYFTEDTVSDEKLNKLGESETLKNILKNRYLQNTLIAVDNASNPEEALRLAMMDPEFVEFVDECLAIVEDTND